MATNDQRRDIVVMGTSAGGIRALRAVLGGLPADFDAAIFIVMHMAAESPGVLPAIIERDATLPVVIATDGMPIERGRIVIAPADYHLLLEPNGVRLSHGSRENRHRPSVDVLFRSAAFAFGPRVIGIVLSGMLDDGAAGLWAIKRRGGFAVVQDPADAEYADMPRNAMKATQVDQCLSATRISERLAGWTRQTVEPAEPASASMASEVGMATDRPIQMEDMDTIGRRVPITCPECGGAMWELDDIGQPRFRCHVGHAYSMLSLAEDQSVRVEAAIWAALRALEENVRISDQLARAAAASGSDDRAAYHEDRSVVSARHAQVLRDVLAQALPAPQEEEATAGITR